MKKGRFCICFITIVLITYKLSFGQPVPAAESLGSYLPLLKGKKVGLVVNQTSLVNGEHLLDVLLKNKINVIKIFGPEHGFRGDADAGEKVDNTTDTKTGLPVISLYGKNKKPFPDQMKDIEVVIFDIQDVGVRFYTYISTLHYVMESCAENNIPLVVLDRPNPNGMYVDGPVLDTALKSFVGMHPIPIVYGLTMGELANMINGEGWLKNKIKCNLKVIKCNGYKHSCTYDLPVKPSPNLPNSLSIALYPSLCLFEGTNVSVARGTTFPFQAIGFPDSTYGGFYFIPKSIVGMAKDPMHNGKKCYGVDLRNQKPSYQFTLSFVIDFYNKTTDKEKYFNNFFNKLAGNKTLIEQIKSGMSEADIKATWQPQLENFKGLRQKYLLYPDSIKVVKK